MAFLFTNNSLIKSCKQQLSQFKITTFTLNGFEVIHSLAREALKAIARSESGRVNMQNG